MGSQITNKKISDYTTKELREICQACHTTLEWKKEDNKIGIFSLNFSIYFTRLFLYTKITPNQITTLSVLVFFAGISLLLFNDYIINIIGSLVIFFSIVLDGCDGEVARFRKFIGNPIKGNVGGLYTEPVSHDVQYGFAFLIIAHALVINGFPPYYYVLGGLASIAKLLFRLLQARFCAILDCRNVTREESTDMHNSLKKKSIFIRIVYRINKNFFNNSGVFIIIFIGALINRIDLSLWFFGVGYTLLWIAMFGKQVYQINKGNIK
ncbi:CDP-alcohol phosphatidyltransferase family protein [Candidatus Parcubacteria bacterium]|nr:CDP-alcohol phosphatidyltransferase family protein [Candidatus Parcubacteria bacterium]